MPSSSQYQDTLQQVTNYFVAQGSPLVQAQEQAIDWIGQQVQAGVVPRLYGRLLGPDAGRARAVPLALSLRKQAGAGQPWRIESAP